MQNQCVIIALAVIVYFNYDLVADPALCTDCLSLYYITKEHIFLYNVAILIPNGR